MMSFRHTKQHDRIKELSFAVATPRNEGEAICWKKQNDVYPVCGLLRTSQ